MKLRCTCSLSMIAGLFFLFFLPRAMGQSETFLFKHLTVKDGLSNDNIWNVYQDRMGFMWMATDLGLNKFDGHTFTVYQNDPSNPATLPSNNISELFEDSHGNFWVGTLFDGLCRFDREREVFVRYQHQPGNPNSISNNLIRAIFEDSKGNLWIGTGGGGLNLYHRETDSFSSIRHNPSGKPDIGSDYILSVAEDRNGNLWLGSSEGLLVKYQVNLQKCTKVVLPGFVEQDLIRQYFCKIYIDSDNRVWMGTATGLYRYDQQKDELKHFVKGSSNRHLNISSVSSVLEVEKGVFLIATDHGGLNVYNEKTNTFRYVMSSRLDETSLSNDQLLRIYRSPDGIIWVCSYRGGVNILDPRVFKFKQYKNLVPAHEKMNSTYSVVSLCEDADHHIWIGKDGQGIDILDPKTGQVRHLYGNHSSGPLPNNNIQALHCDRKGNVWIGTYMAGAARYNPATRKYTYFRHDPKNPKGPGSNNIWKIYEDRRGYIWFGTFGDGLDRMDPRTGLFRHYQFDPADTTSLNDRYVIEIFEDRRGVLWMGTRKGLCRYNPRTDKFLRIKNLIGEGSVYNICEDDAGHLWYGTDKGLVCYDTASRSMTLYDRKNGLRGLAVYGTVKDNHHKLWVSTNQGISCFNMLQNRFRNYILNDGLQDLEFNFTAVLQSSEGIIYFGGKNGMNFFNPDSLQDNLMVPPVYFTGLKVLGKPVRISAKKGMLTRHINFEKRIVLRHWQNVFSIDFAALNYINSANNRYACMLEGFDNNWNDLGNNHEVTYTNLDAGKYVLKVQASNNDGVWNREGARIEIIVLPPWWKTWWARVIFYFLLACLLFAVYYVRVAFFRNQQKRLMKLVKERTIQLEEVAVSLEEKQEEINSQNEELATANNMLVAQKDMILEQNQELDHHRSKLELLVEERTREYLAAKENAEESDRLKSSFLANLSHEIRTPLNAILGFSSLLGDSELDSIERAEYNRIIQSSSDTLLDLISDILDISKIEAGLLELDLQPVTVGNVILDMKGIYDLFLKREDIGLNKPVHLQLAIEDEVRGMTILTDKVRLEQIISNLLSNALKFTRRGYIELGCFKTRDKANLEFYVKDTGVGIKKEHQQLIFERFRKVEDDKSQVQRGTGLGLAISAQLVALLGGSIQVDSTPGVGSLFSFTIPLVPAGNEVLSAVPEVTTGQMPDFGQCRVLVAEDEPSNFQYISKLLKKAGIDVLHAEDGMEVLEQLSKVKDIRLILMDIKMPRKDGIETLHEIVKLEMDIPVIAQTAYALADEIVKLKKEGFVDYISKPIQAAQLYTVLGKFLKPSH